MNNKKCPNCGFINFLKAESCRKCETSLAAGSQPEQTYYRPDLPGGYGQSYSYSNPHKPAKGSEFPVVKVLLSIGALVVVSLVICVVFTVAFVLRPHSKISWREFRPGEPGLSVMMPGEPTVHDVVVTPMQSGDLKNYPYTATVTGQGTVMFCIVVYPFNFSTYKIPYDKLLDVEVEDLMKRTNSTLISKTEVHENGLPGLAFQFKPSDNRGSRVEKGYGKLLLGTNRLYFLSLVAAENSDLLRDKDKFLNATLPYLTRSATRRQIRARIHPPSTGIEVPVI